MLTTPTREKLFKTAVRLSREQLAQLDRMDRDSRFSIGGRLAMQTVVALMLEILVRLRFSADGIHSSDDFYERLRREWNAHPETVLRGRA